MCNFQVKFEFNRKSFSWFSHTIGIHVQFSLQGSDPHLSLRRWTYVKLIVYGKTNWGKDFPSALEDRMEVKKYASSFYSALSPILKELVDGDEHIMRACSVLAIPPSPPGTPLRHIEIPMDLTMMSLPEWIDKISNLATGMVLLPLPSWLLVGWCSHLYCQSLKRYQESGSAGSPSIHTQCVDVVKCPHGAMPQPGCLLL